jgi:hypothetical protein
MNDWEGGYEGRRRKRMQLVLLGWCTPCGSKDNSGWLQFSVVPTQNFTVECIIASPYFADFFSGCCVFHVVQDWKSLIKLCVRPGDLETWTLIWL